MMWLASCWLLIGLVVAENATTNNSSNESVVRIFYGSDRGRDLVVNNYVEVTTTTTTTTSINMLRRRHQQHSPHRVKINRKRCRYSEQEIDELNSRNLKRLGGYYSTRDSGAAETKHQPRVRDQFHMRYGDSSMCISCILFGSCRF